MMRQYNPFSKELIRDQNRLKVKLVPNPGYDITEVRVRPNKLKVRLTPTGDKAQEIVSSIMLPVLVEPQKVTLARESLEPRKTHQIDLLQKEIRMPGFHP